MTFFDKHAKPLLRASLAVNILLFATLFLLAADYCHFRGLKAYALDLRLKYDRLAVGMDVEAVEKILGAPAYTFETDLGGYDLPDAVRASATEDGKIAGTRWSYAYEYGAILPVKSGIWLTFTQDGRLVHKRTVSGFLEATPEEIKNRSDSQLLALLYAMLYQR